MHFYQIQLIKKYQLIESQIRKLYLNQSHYLKQSKIIQIKSPQSRQQNTKNCAMIINIKNKSNMYQLPKQQINSVPIRVPLTPGSKHKDKLKIDENYKRRQSNRKSIHRKITWIQFQGQPRRKRKTRNGRYSAQMQSVDKQLSRRVEGLSQQVQKRDQYIKALIQKINNTMHLTQSTKKTKQSSRQTYFNQNNIIRQLKQYVEYTNQLTYLTQQTKDNIHFFTKRTLFKIASQQLQKSTNIAKIQEEIYNRNLFINRKMDCIRGLAQAVVFQQMKSNDLKGLLEEQLQCYRKVCHNYQIQQSQLFVLKFQINSWIFWGFVVRDSGFDRKLLLDKGYVTWDRNKQKKITQGDLKRFLLIQLYRGWKNIMRKLSYQSSQYQVLFGQLESQPILQDLKRLLSEQQTTENKKKLLQPHIVIYSQNQSHPHPHLQFLQSSLKNFNNGLIHIHKIQESGEQSIKELSIYFTYLGCEQLVEKFTWQECGNVNKEKVGRDLKGGNDRRVFCLIEVPIIVHKDEEKRYDEVFQLVKKRKIVNIRSVSK